MAGNAAPDGELARLLVEDGFANVAAVTGDRRVVVTYENARYRDPRRALSRAAELLLPALAAGHELVLVPAVTGVPVLSARYSSAGLQHGRPAEPSAVSLDVTDLPPSLAEARRRSSSLGRLDVVLHPWFEASFGDFDNPVASRLGIAPELRMALRPGLTVSAQALFTIQDDLPTGDSRVRPGVVTVNQTVRLPRNVFVSATAGTFTRDRYGVDVETVAYTNNGRWSVGAEFGLTGESSFASQGWSFSPVNAPTALVTAASRLPRYRTTVRAAVGIFLADERGARIDVTRRFGEFELGWFGVATGGGANGGVTLRIPLPQRRYAMPAPVRVRVAEWFRWQYRYHGLVSGGRPYDTGPAPGAASIDFLVTSAAIHPDGEGRPRPGSEQGTEAIGARAFVPRGSISPSVEDRTAPRKAPGSAGPCRRSVFSTRSDCAFFQAEGSAQVDHDRDCAAANTCVRSVVHGQSLAGTTGLVSIPTAEMPADGTLAVGMNLLARRYHGYATPEYGEHSVMVQFVSIGFLPFAEVGLRLTRATGVPRQALGDRMVSVRVRVLEEGRRTPAVVVGAHDLVGTRYFHTTYAVTTKSVTAPPLIGTVGLHLGYGGNPLSLTRAGDPLTGPFGGISVAPARWASVFAEYDTEHVNAGARLRVGRFALLAAAQNLEGLSAGLSYTQPLHR